MNAIAPKKIDKLNTNDDLSIKFKKNLLEKLRRNNKKELRKKFRFPLESNEMPNEGCRKSTDFVRHFFNFGYVKRALTNTFT